MKEYKVGEQIVLEVVKTERSSCKGCYFCSKNVCGVCSIYPCGKKVRSDNTDVIFVEKGK